MDFTRPDNINSQLSEGLIRSDYGDKLNTKNNIFTYLFILFLIIIISLLSWWYLTHNKSYVLGGDTGIALPISNIIIPPVYTRSTATSTSSSSTTTVGLPETEQIFYTLWPDAVTGYSYVGDSIIFQDKNTGHIYRVDSPDYKPYKIANTTINNLFISHFANNGKTIIFQTLNQNTNTLSTYIADTPNYNNAGGSIVPENLNNKAYLGDAVNSFDVSPDDTNIAYITTDKDYNSVINLLNVYNRKVKIINSYPLSSLHLDYYSSSTIYMYQYPDETIVTQAYSININSGNISPIKKSQALEIKGSGAGLIYSNSDGLYIDHKTKSKKDITDKSSFETRANKCAWSYSGAFILCAVDNNYNSKKLNASMMGTYMPNDNIYMHGVSYPEERMIYDFQNYSNTKVNVYSMSISKNADTLTVMDRVKGLYLLKINTILSAESN